MKTAAKSAACVLLLLALGACAEPMKPISPGPEGWLSILGGDPAFALSGSQEAREHGWTSENAKAFAILPSGALRAASGEAASVQRDIDGLLLTTPYFTWRWRVEPGPFKGYARLHLALGFETEGKQRRLIIAWSDDEKQIGRLERQGNAAYFIAQAGAGDGNWREATLDVGQLHRLAWPDVNTLFTRLTYVAIFTPETKDGPACEIEKLAISR